MSNATEQHIGTDGYSGTKAAAVVGITYRQLDYWARTDLVRPSLADASGSGTRRMYSYRDLLELRVIKSLLDAGIKLESVRKAFEYLREQVTDDIASAFGTTRLQAERIKCFHGSANASPRDNHEMVTIRERTEEEDSEALQITKAALIAVIRTRLEHWATEIQKALKELRFEGPVARQVVLTGGGAELKGIADYAQQALGRSVRVGRPRGMTGLPEAHSGPGFSTLAGLAFFAASDPIDLRAIAPRQQAVTKAKGLRGISRLLQAAKANY